MAGQAFEHDLKAIRRIRRAVRDLTPRERTAVLNYCLSEAVRCEDQLDLGGGQIDVFRKEAFGSGDSVQAARTK